MSSQYNKGKSGQSRGGPRQHSGHGSLTAVKGGELPKWVRDEIQRSTPKDRREPAFNHLSRGLEKFADERYGAALPELRQAKTLAPRSSTIRELLGLAAYRSGNWEEGLREVRTFRRITGDLIHMPVEMDCLRALGRGSEVTKTWDRIIELDPSSTVSHEAAVVYASYLLDDGRPREAWDIIKPGRLVANPSPGELRQWFVAARVAIAAGDKDAGRRIVAALDRQELDFEGIEELRAALV